MTNFFKTSLVVSILTLLLTASLAAADIGTGTLTGKIELTKGTNGKNSIVYLKEVNGKFAPPQEAAVVDQKAKTFIPHLLAVQVGQKVIFGNDDPFSHNVHLYWGRRSMFNQVQGVGGTTELIAKRTGVYSILCDIHPEMFAAVVVLNHPFFASVDSQSGGEFVIEDVPAGSYTLVLVRGVRGKLKTQEQQVLVKAGELNKVTLRY